MPLVSKQKSYTKKWYLANRERIQKLYIKNRKGILARQAVYRVKNKERIAAYQATYYKKNRKSILKKKVKWAMENMHSIYTKNAKRRANKLRATPKWADMEMIRNMYMEAAYQDMEVDHIIPLQSNVVCGLHWEGNLQLLTAHDNRTKGNKFAQSF